VEAITKLRIVDQGCVQKFDGKGSLKDFVLRLEDHTHATGSNLANQAEASKLETDAGCTLIER
jgi:hypothetical protein